MHQVFRRHTKLPAILISLILLISHAAATAQETPRHWLIGTKEAPPFAMKQSDGTWRGISIELWAGLAERVRGEMIVKLLREADRVLSDKSANGSYGTSIYRFGGLFG